MTYLFLFFFSSRRRHTRCSRDWSSDVCSSDLVANTDARNLAHFEPVLRGFFVTNQISRINIGSGAVTKYDLNSGFNPTNFTLADKTNALAQPAAIIFAPDG